MPERPEDSDVVFDKFFRLLRPDDPVDKLRSFIGDEFTAVPQGEALSGNRSDRLQQGGGIHILQKKLGIPPRTTVMPLGTLKTIFRCWRLCPTALRWVLLKTILPYCSYRTTPVLEDGIANALKHYGLI